MHKIHQTIVDKGNGNCLQAAIASLFNLQLEQVPHFIEYGNEWYPMMAQFYDLKGYEIGILGMHGTCINEARKCLHFDGGVNGYFAASVPSQVYKDVTHAVIIDMDLNIVHDPNPNGKALLLGPEDIIDVTFVNGYKGWHFNTEGKFIKE